MQLWLMLKLNIKYTYTLTEGLHKTSHQMADLVCIIDMLGYLVLLFYILSHPGDKQKLLMARHMMFSAPSTAVQVEGRNMKQSQTQFLLTTSTQVGA